MLHTALPQRRRLVWTAQVTVPRSLQQDSVTKHDGDGTVLFLTAPRPTEAWLSAICRSS